VLSQGNGAMPLRFLSNNFADNIYYNFDSRKAPKTTLQNFIYQWRSQKFVMEGVQNLVGVGVSGGRVPPRKFWTDTTFAWPNWIFIAQLLITMVGCLCRVCCNISRVAYLASI